MRVALFVPCYVDQLRPEVGLAAAALLERQGVEVHFPEDQTCCGQPLLSSGGVREARALAARFLRVFAGAEAIVCPSASCVSTVVSHYRSLVGHSPELDAVASRCFELCSFLVEGLGVEALAGRYPHRVGLHGSCHALRGLRRGAASERRAPPQPDPARQLLASLDGLAFGQLARPDECCGFGGAFSVEEGAVSRLMGLDRLRDHSRAGVEVIASTDLSCLLHLDGLARREGLALRTRHVAEILAEATGAHP